MMRRREFLTNTAGFGVAALAAGPLAGAESKQTPTRQDQGRPATGPLRVHRHNPRYFSDGDGRVIYLTGSHVWNNLVDMGPSDPPPKFDFEAYLDFLQQYGHNFIRLWTWEHVTWDTSANKPWGKNKAHTVAPHPWTRTGPGQALDGKRRFDLDKFSDKYFQRLRSRTVAAGKQGIYVSVMLFEGWAMQRMGDAWSSHPFHPKNNINGINGEAGGTERGLEIHTLANRAVTARQDAYVRKVVDTVGDLDNVLFEISNENHPASTEWQYHMIDLIHEYEQEKPKQHPVGMTFQYRGGNNKTLFDSRADWISPNADGGYRDNPPAAEGSKVILSDTDHLWGIGGNRVWVWKSFLRGHNPIFMDPYDGTVLGTPDDKRWQPIREALGHTRHFAERINLATMTPRIELASTRYCLAHPGSEYLAYQPNSGAFNVTLAGGKYILNWYDPTNGARSNGDTITVQPGARRFTAPFTGQAVIYLKRWQS